ncbi:MAG: hypothetical protein V4556_07460 [Bacteroidota bacterium]
MTIADSISKEGERLYRSESASWFGTDIFLENFKSEVSNMEGYFSYENNGNYKCIFFSKRDSMPVLCTITFGNSFDSIKANIDDTKRNFTNEELEYYKIRKIALKELQRDTNFFQGYKNTSFNLIPIINKTEKKVYILTGTSRSDIVIIGNDYLLNFDMENNLISKRKLHANILTLDTKVEETNQDGSKNMGNVHNHLPETGDFITATDICTFRLYKNLTNWKQQLVISEKFLSIWNCETDKLIIVPTGQ